MTSRVLYPRVLLQGSIANCHTESLSWQVQPSPLTSNSLVKLLLKPGRNKGCAEPLWKDSHPKERHHGLWEGWCTADHLENDHRTLREITPVFNGHELPHTCRVLRSSQAGAHVKRSFRYMCYLPDWLQSLPHKEMMKPWLQDEARYPCLHHSVLHPRTGMLPEHTEPGNTSQCLSLHKALNVENNRESLSALLHSASTFQGQTLSAVFLVSATTAALPVCWLPPLLFLASANDNKLLICLQTTFTAESRKLHQRKW